jgi:hypothetical protein
MDDGRPQLFSEKPVKILLRKLVETLCLTLETEHNKLLACEESINGYLLSKAGIRRRPGRTSRD